MSLLSQKSTLDATALRVTIISFHVIQGAGAHPVHQVVSVTDISSSMNAATAPAQPQALGNPFKHQRYVLVQPSCVLSRRKRWHHSSSILWRLGQACPQQVGHCCFCYLL